MLPSMIHPEHISSLLHFLYLGDYSVDKKDLENYKVPPCPTGCVTCTQICKLLRYHLFMFRTALLLGIVGLQALAFGRFRGLLDTSPAWVLKFAVHLVYSRPPIPDGCNDYHVSAIKGLGDYRPELVLPAVLRWCGYYRMHPEHGRGEQEFSQLRRMSRRFNTHLTFGLWLDTVHIQVPKLKFPGHSDLMICIHPHLHTGLPPMAVDRKRSNYQYVTYLQPLPFEPFSEQRPTNVPARVLSPTYYSGTTHQNLQNASQNQTPVNPVPRIPMQQQYQPQQSNPLQAPDTSSNLDDILDFDMSTTEPLPQTIPMVPVAMNPSDVSFDITQGDLKTAGLPDSDFGFDFDQTLNDQSIFLQDATAFDWTQSVNWDEAPIVNTEDFLNNDAMDIDTSGQSSHSLPKIHFSGLDTLHPSPRAPEEIVPRETQGFNSLDHMLQDYSLQSATINASFDWGKATASAAEPTESGREETEIKSPASSRYNLRSGSSITTAASEYVPSTPFSENFPSKASVASTASKTCLASPKSRQSTITSLKKPRARPSRATLKGYLAATTRYNLRRRLALATRRSLKSHP
jgi:hypothetical protein